jgi:hypothetical protein
MLLAGARGDFVAWLEACKEELPLVFFSLMRLRAVTILQETDRKETMIRLIAGIEDSAF